MLTNKAPRNPAWSTSSCNSAWPCQADPPTTAAEPTTSSNFNQRNQGSGAGSIWWRGALASMAVRQRGTRCCIFDGFDRNAGAVGHKADSQASTRANGAGCAPSTTSSMSGSAATSIAARSRVPGSPGGADEREKRLPMAHRRFWLAQVFAGGVVLKPARFLFVVMRRG